MSTRILHKRNSTANTPPQAGDLSAGELAFNTADGKLYLKRDDNVIIDVSQSIFQRDTKFTVVDDGVNPGTITGEIDGTQVLQVDAAGVTLDGGLEINSAETLFFNDADNSEYVGVRVPDTVGSSYIIKLPDTLPQDKKSLLSIDNKGNTLWDEVNPFAAFTIYVSEEYGDDTGDGFQNPVKTVKRGAQLAAEMSKVPTTPATDSQLAVKRLVPDNIDFLIEETIGFVNTTYPGLTYTENLWRSTFRLAIEAVRYDNFLSGNSATVAAGETANTDITDETEFVAALEHLRDITVNVINNQPPATSYQGLIEQETVEQLDGSAENSNIIAGYNTIRDIISSDTSPAVVEADFKVVPVTVSLAGGEFNVDNPVIISDNVTVSGSSSRGVVLRPLNANADMFRVRNASGILNLTLRDAIDASGNPTGKFQWAVAFDDPSDPTVSRADYFGLLNTKPVISVPPLFQNVLLVSFLGANGIEVDGSKVDRPASFPAPEVQRQIFRGFGFAFSTFGGIGVLASNNGYAQISSCTFSFCSNGIYARSGGFVEATNSGTAFGIYGLRASGYRQSALLDDTGIVVDTGLTAEGTQFMRLVGPRRFPLEEYVIRIRDVGTEADITNSFKTPTTVNSFNAATAVNASTNVFTITSHGYSDGDAVVYSPDGNTPIDGLEEGVSYYVDAVTTDTFELYNDEGLQFAVNITAASTGTHEFSSDTEEFFIESRRDLHEDYQVVVTEPGSFAFQPGDLILGTTVGQTNTAYVYSYNDSTDTLILSNEETAGSKVLFDNTSVITDIAGSSVSINVNSANSLSEYRTATVIVDSTVPASTVQNISNAEGQIIRLHRPSTVVASSHVWEYAGAGTDFDALDETLCCSEGTTFQYRQDLPGRVYPTGSDERGDWKLNGIMVAEPRGNKVKFNSIVEMEDLRVVELSLNDVTVTEISTDVGLGDNEPFGAQDTRLSTQRAVRSFAANRLGNVLDKAVSSSAVPRALVQLNANGQINAGLLPPGRGISTIPVAGFESRLDVSREIPATSLLVGDQVAETYDQQVLDLTGTVTVAKGSEIIQQNTGATGYVKEDVSSGTSVILVGPLSGTFNTTDELEDDGSALGANSVPTVVGTVDTITDNYFLTTDTDSQFLQLSTSGTYDFTGVTAVEGARSGGTGDITSGPVEGVLTTVNNLVAGSGYTPLSGTETYELVSLTGGTGTTAHADITVTDGAVVDVDIRRGGEDYVVGDTLSANAADIGGTGSSFSVDVDSVQVRLFVDLTGNRIQFNANSQVPDYIEDANADVNTIADLTVANVQNFDAEDTGAAGDVSYLSETITITGHPYASGDPVEYDDGGNGTIGNLTVGNSYWVKVLDANTIELYADYALSSGSQILFGTQSTGVHSLTRYTVDTNINEFVIINHGYNTGDPIQIEGSDLPDPLEDGEFFYVGSVRPDSFTVHVSRTDALASISGASISPVVFSTTGTGSATFTTQNVEVVGAVNTSSRDIANWNVISQQTIDASNIVSGTVATQRLASGTANDTTFLRGDQSWARAVQTMTTPSTDPIRLTGTFFTDTGTDFYYDSVQVAVNSVQPGTDPTYSTLGVAQFNKNQFNISAGQVSILNNTINAGFLNGNDGSYYLDPANISGTVQTGIGGTGLTTYTTGDLLYSGASNSLSQLAIGAPNTVLTSNGSIPAWRSSLTLASTLTVAGITEVTNATQSSSTTSGALQVDGGAGIVKNLNVGGDTDIAGGLTVNGNTTFNSPSFNSTGLTIVVADGSANAAAADGAGLVVDLGSSGTSSFLYDSSDNVMNLNKGLTLDNGLSGDTIFTIRADSDDNAEGDHPSIRLKQDGDNVDYRIGLGVNDGDTVGATANALVINALSGVAADSLKFSPDNGVTVNTIFHDGYHPNADTLTTARNISVSGAVTGSVSFDGSGNVDIATTATSDPTLTLAGDLSGSATFTNLGNATLTAAVADDSHNHTTLSNVTAINFAAQTTDAASISTIIDVDTTYLDFNLGNDNNQEEFRWRFSPDGSSSYTAMRLVPQTDTQSSLEVSGNVRSESIVLQDLVVKTVATASTTTTGQFTLIEFPAVDYQSAEVFIQAVEGNFVHVSKLIIAHNGTTASATEFGSIKTDGVLFTTDVDINSGNVRVLVTSAQVDLTAYTANYTLVSRSPATTIAGGAPLVVSDFSPNS